MFTVSSKEAEPDTTTSGQKWCGVSFNPSKNPSVDEIKQQFAAAADSLERWVGQREEGLTADEQILYEGAKLDLLRSQMLTVKLFTYSL